MKKLILGVFAALTAFLAAPVMAQVTPPSHVQMITVTVGKLEGDVVPVTANGKTLKVKLEGCEAARKTGDEFYAITAPGTGVFIMHKKLTEYAYGRMEKNWDATIRVMLQANQICHIAPAE